MEGIERFRAWFDALPVPGLVPWTVAIAVVVVGLLIAGGSRRLVGRVAGERLEPQAAMIVQRAVYWAIVLLAGATAMRQVGFDLSVLMGAAGILTVAIGFASQTSASNLISGLFLLGERPFVVGDTIQVGGTVGQVVSIDLLSVKLRTFDNRLVRVPNESLLKTEIVNLTHYRIRRVDVMLRASFEVDLPRLRAALLSAADGVPHVLDEPRPAVSFDRFDDLGVVVQFSAWTPRETVLEAKDAMAAAVLAALGREGIAVARIAAAPVPDALRAG